MKDKKKKKINLKPSESRFSLQMGAPPLNQSPLGSFLPSFAHGESGESERREDVSEILVVGQEEKKKDGKDRT